MGAVISPARTPSPPEAPVCGMIERVTFHSETTGFCVLRVKARGHRDLVTVVRRCAGVAGSGSSRAGPGLATGSEPGATAAHLGSPSWPAAGCGGTGDAARGGNCGSAGCGRAGWGAAALALAISLSCLDCFCCLGWGSAGRDGAGGGGGGAGLSAGGSAWTQALSAAPKGDAAEAMLRLEMAAEAPTPAEHLAARRILQLQLLTRRNDPAPAQTWGQDVARVLAGPSDAASARRLQNVLKTLLRK